MNGASRSSGTALAPAETTPSGKDVTGERDVSGLAKDTVVYGMSSIVPKMLSWFLGLFWAFALQTLARQESLPTVTSTAPSVQGWMNVGWGRTIRGSTDVWVVEREDPMTNTMRSTLAIGAVTAVLMLGLAACTAEEPSDDLSGLTRPGSGADAVPGGTAGSGQPSTDETAPELGAKEPLPIEHYFLLGRDRETVEGALRILIDQCMQDKGFDLDWPPIIPSRGGMVDFAFRRYGAPETLADAQEIGYGMPAWAEATAEEAAAHDRFSQEISPAAIDALGSIVEGQLDTSEGCFAEAHRRLTGDSKVVDASGLMFAPFLRDINMDPRATESEESTAAIEKFARCMSDAGYPDKVHPLGEKPAPFENTDPDNPSEAEKQAAIATFRCFEESQVREAMRAAEIEFQKQAIEANPELFAQYRRELDDVLRRATEIVGER